MRGSTKRMVAVVTTGAGEEREVSTRTGAAVLAALGRLGVPAEPIVADGSLDVGLRALSPDAVYLATHGRLGEDGRVQGLLEVLGLPYTGSGVLASALAMDKAATKVVLRQANLPTPLGYVVSAERPVDGAPVGLGFPCLVKPTRSGSSVGVQVVGDAEQLERAVGAARVYGGDVLVERLFRGREVTIGLLDGGVLGACEIEHGGTVFDYERKYVTRPQHHVPPRLSQARLRGLEALALAAYRALGCRGHARVDLMVSDAANEVILEVNTLPGLTPESLLPEIAAAAGLTFDELVLRILRGARTDDGPAVHAGSWSLA